MSFREPSKNRERSVQVAKPFTDQQRSDIREIFEDVYLANRWTLVRASFFRGLALGLGTFLGGTVVVALVVWLLSRTTDLFPWMQNLLEVLKR